MCINCRWLMIAVSVFVLALVSGALPVQAEEGLTVRSSLYLQQDGDHPLKVGSGVRWVPCLRGSWAPTNVPWSG